MNRKTSILALVIMGFGTQLLLNCASYTQSTVKMREAFYDENYQQALKELEASDLKPDNRHRLLFFLESSMIYERMGDAKKSRKFLLEADRVADELYTTSISKTLATFIYNEAAADYAGEDFEIVAIHTLLALSFLEDSDLDAAAIQARKINNKLYEINQRHGDSPNKYKVDAFALVLSGLIFEAKQLFDDAIIDYKKSLDLFEKDYEPFYRGSVPDEIVLSLANLYEKRNRTQQLASLKAKYPKVLEKTKKSIASTEAKGAVVVVHQLGHVALKKAQEHLLPISGQIVRFSFPIIDDKRFHFKGKTGVEVEKSSEFFPSVNVQDMNSIASQTLADRMTRIVLKQGARLLVKGQMNYQAKKQFGEIGGLVSNAFTAVTETADTRSWTLMPGAFNLSRIELPVGSHTLKVYTEGKISEIKNVTIKAGELKILRIK